MQKVKEKTFISPLEKDTPEEAERVLGEIRKAHSEKKHWEEKDAGIEQLPNGKWRAWTIYQKLA